MMEEFFLVVDHLIWMAAGALAFIIFMLAYYGNQPPRGPGSFQ